MQKATPPHGRARIWTGEPARITGAGVLITTDVVVTCAHVLTLGSVAVDFPDAPAVAPISAQITEAAPAIPGRGGDLAALKLARPVDLPVARLSSRTVDSQQVRIFGFPASVPTGVWVRVSVTGDTDRQTVWRQLDRVEGSAAVERGFSGGGVFDALGSVVGAVSARVVLSGQVVSWMIPVRSWQSLLPTTRIPDHSPPETVVPARPAADSPNGLTFAQKHAIAEALLLVSVMADPDARQTVLVNLSYASSVPRQTAGNLDVFSLVRTALQVNGFAELYSVVAAFSPQDEALRRVRELAREAGLLPEDDES